MRVEGRGQTQPETKSLQGKRHERDGRPAGAAEGARGGGQEVQYLPLPVSGRGSPGPAEHPEHRGQHELLSRLEIPPLILTKITVHIYIFINLLVFVAYSVYPFCISII